MIWLTLPQGSENGAGFDASPANGAPESAPGNRCTHFSMTVYRLAIRGVHPPMRVPVYHCALAEEMITRLKTTSQGQKLAISMEAPPLEGQLRLICGPDLEAISTATCTFDRCHRSCRPSFEQILSDLQLDHDLPE